MNQQLAASLLAQAASPSSQSITQEGMNKLLQQLITGNTTTSSSNNNAAAAQSVSGTSAGGGMSCLNSSSSSVIQSPPSYQQQNNSAAAAAAPGISSFQQQPSLQQQTSSQSSINSANQVRSPYQQQQPALEQLLPIFQLLATKNGNNNASSISNTNTTIGNQLRQLPPSALSVSSVPSVPATTTNNNNNGNSNRNSNLQLLQMLQKLNNGNGSSSSNNSNNGIASSLFSQQPPPQLQSQLSRGSSFLSPPPSATGMPPSGNNSSLGITNAQADQNPSAAQALPSSTAQQQALPSSNAPSAAAVAAALGGLGVGAPTAAAPALVVNELLSTLCQLLVNQNEQQQAQLSQQQHQLNQQETLGNGNNNLMLQLLGAPNRNSNLPHTISESSVTSPSNLDTDSGEGSGAASVNGSTSGSATTSTQKSTGGKKHPLSNIEYPGAHDVMLGRGSGTSNHIGNIQFRMLVNKHKPRYVAASRVDKPKVAGEVVDIWRNMTPPGRFLVRCDENQGDMSLWKDVGDRKARQKTSQCLREKERPKREQERKRKRLADL